MTLLALTFALLLAASAYGDPPLPISISGSRTWTNSAGVLVPFPSASIPIKVIGLTMTSATNLSALGTGFLATDPFGGESLGTFGSGLNFSGGVLTSTGAGNALAAGTNAAATTNGLLVTLSGVTDTNAVNGLIGWVTNGAVNNLSNLVATISQNATNQSQKVTNILYAPAVTGLLPNTVTPTNTINQSGVVTSGSGNPSLFWGTDSGGNPGWRSPSAGGAATNAVTIISGTNVALVNPATNLDFWAGPNIVPFVTNRSSHADLAYQLLGTLTNNTSGNTANATNDSTGTALQTRFLQFTNNDTAVSNYAALVVGVGATNEALLLSGNDTNYAIARNAGFGTNTTIYGDANKSNQFVVDVSGFRSTNAAGGIYATGNVLYASGQASFAVITNRAFAAIGAVTNDALGNLYTTPTLPAPLAPGSNAVTIAGSGVTVTTNYVAGGVTYTLVNSGAGIAAAAGVDVLLSTNASVVTVNLNTNMTNIASISFTNGSLIGAGSPPGTLLTLTNANVGGGYQLIVFTNGQIDVLSGITNGGFAAIGVVTNDANGKLYTTPTIGNALLANSSITVAGTANQVAVSGGGPVALGGTATLSLPSPTVAPGQVSATGLTNTAFAAIGVVTNDAAGKLYTTPILPPPLLNLLNATNNDAQVTNYAALVVGVGATNEVTRQVTLSTNGGFSLNQIARSNIVDQIQTWPTSTNQLVALPGSTSWLLQSATPVAITNISGTLSASQWMFQTLTSSNSTAAAVTNWITIPGAVAVGYAATNSVGALGVPGVVVPAAKSLNIMFMFRLGQTNWAVINP